MNHKAQMYTCVLQEGEDSKLGKREAKEPARGEPETECKTVEDTSKTETCPVVAETEETDEETRHQADDKTETEARKQTKMEGSETIESAEGRAKSSAKANETDERQDCAIGDKSVENLRGGESEGFDGSKGSDDVNTTVPKSNKVFGEVRKKAKAKEDEKMESSQSAKHVSIRFYPKENILNKLINKNY